MSEETPAYPSAHLRQSKHSWEPNKRNIKRPRYSSQQPGTCIQDRGLISIYLVYSVLKILWWGITWRLLIGSIFWTGPVGFKRRETSQDWFGAKGDGTWRVWAGSKPKLFLLNWIANPLMGCIALLENFISMKICPFLNSFIWLISKFIGLIIFHCLKLRFSEYLLANVPEISNPFPFTAGNHRVLGATYTDSVGPKISPKSPPPPPIIIEFAGCTAGPLPSPLEIPEDGGPTSN